MKIGLASILSLVVDKMFWRDIRSGFRQERAERILTRICELTRKRKNFTEDELVELYGLMKKDVWFSVIVGKLSHVNELKDFDRSTIEKLAKQCLQSIRIHGYIQAKKTYKDAVAAQEVKDSEYEFTLLERILFTIITVVVVIGILVLINFCLQMIIPLLK